MGNSIIVDGDEVPGQLTFVANFMKYLSKEVPHGDYVVTIKATAVGSSPL